MTSKPKPAAAAAEPVDYYGLLGIPIESSAKEIATAYRRKALVVHPDKNPDDPKAAALFHELSKAYDVLSDVAKRAEYDTLVRAKIERRKRHEQLDSKRRKLKDDLLERELAARELREREQEARRELEERMSRMRHEGLARQQEEEEARARELFAQAEREASPEPSAPSALLEQVSELDKTLKVKWDPARRPLSETDLRAAFASFGPVDSLLVSAKRPGTAVVAYESIVSAHAAVVAQGTAVELAGIQLQWAQGAEPEILARLPELTTAAAIVQAHTAIRAATEAVAAAATAGPTAATIPPVAPPTAAARPGTASGLPPSAASSSLFGVLASTAPTAGTAFAALAANKDYENLTLMRMRRAQERQRLINEMQNEDPTG